MKNIFSYILIALVMCSLSACLKDTGSFNKAELASNTDKAFAEIPEAVNDINVFSLDAVPPVEELMIFNVNIAAATLLTKDYTVTLALNPTLIADYNTAKGESYEALPFSAYTITNTLSVVVPKGKQKTAVSIKIDKSKLDFSKSYALGFKIADGGGATINENFKNVLVAIGVKNKFDGHFNLRIKTTGWTAYGIADGISGSFPNGLDLVTAGSASVSFFNPSIGSNQPAFTGTTNVPGTIIAATSFGATTPLLTFDQTSNKLVSVVNTTPDDGRARTLTLNTAVTTSRFDPNTKTIYAAYIMSQTGRPDQFIYDTLTYVGPR